MSGPKEEEKEIGIDHEEHGCGVTEYFGRYLFGSHDLGHRFTLHIKEKLDTFMYSVYFSRSNEDRKERREREKRFFSNNTSLIH